MITRYILSVLLVANVAFAQMPGDLDPNFQASEFFNQLSGYDAVYSLKEDNQGYIYVGGDFEIFSNGNTFKNIIKLKPNGTIDESFKPSPLNASIRDIAIQDDGKVILTIYGFVEGYTFGSTNVNAVIRLNTDGTLDDTFNYSNDTKKFGWKLLLLENGDVLAAGAYGFFVRLSNRGELVKDYNPDNSVYGDNFMKDLYLLDNNDILIGGDFEKYNNDNHKYIAKIKLDGTLDKSFKLSNELLAQYSFGKILLLPNGDILAAVVSRQHVSSIIKLNNVGEMYNQEQFQTPAPLDNYVYNIAHISDGNFVATSVANPGLPKQRLFFLRANGSINPDYNVAQGFNATSFALYVQNDGKILTGGNFTSYNNQSAPRIARLLGKTMSVNNIDDLNNSIQVYPNPANDIIYINNANELSHYQVLNMTGQIILKGYLKNNKIDISKLNQGQYILTIENENISFLVK